ncbi:hypothetical protein RJT34_18418 [Clitoria ternatea]|uniref:Uncharacterized protein n=1 Tax=Clitoria ternatea TaxID=43366 RepID=A0AAN9JDX6_CLITE
MLMTCEHALTKGESFVLHGTCILAISILYLIVQFTCHAYAYLKSLVPWKWTEIVSTFVMDTILEGTNTHVVLIQEPVHFLCIIQL